MTGLLGVGTDRFLSTFGNVCKFSYGCRLCYFCHDSTSIWWHIYVDNDNEHGDRGQFTMAASLTTEVSDSLVSNGLSTEDAPKMCSSNSFPPVSHFCLHLRPLKSLETVQSWRLAVNSNTVPCKLLTPSCTVYSTEAPKCHGGRKI